MSTSLPPAINSKKHNIFEIDLPYNLLGASSIEKPYWVIFWGANWKDLPSVNESEFIRQTNLCLDYIRRECAGCRLIYKPHPAETTEFNEIDLRGFEITKERTVSEFFMLKNYNKIKYVFSACSGASLTAVNMGLNSYCFLPLFEPSFIEKTRQGYEWYFRDMSPDFFISDLNKPLKENKKFFNQNELLHKNFADLLETKNGTIWFIVGDPGLLTAVILLVRLARNLSNNRKICLIIENHHRWKTMDMAEVGSYFDEVKIFPRLFYSLRPSKIFKQIKTVLQIRKIKVDPEDILIGFTVNSFIENCFMSYFSRSHRILFISKKSFDMCFGPKDKSFFNSYFSRRAAMFSNLILEPLLGLNRTVYREDPGRVSNFNRYQHAVNDIYDQIYKF